MKLHYNKKKMQNIIIEEIKNVKGRKSHPKGPRRTESTCASSSFDAPKVIRNIETAKHNLELLAKKYKGINNVQGFLTDLWIALGIQNQGNDKNGGKPSRYAEYILQDGTKLSISIRASAHNANADNYLEHQPVPDINLSILLQKKMRKNNFKSNSLVNLGEFVYVNKKIKDVKDPLTKIANSLIGFLNNGTYVDTTGVAIVHGKLQTPKEIIQNKKQNSDNCMSYEEKKSLYENIMNEIARIVKSKINQLD